MTRTVIRSKLGKDGVLHLDVPFGVSEASIDVNVTVEPVSTQPQMTQQEWQEWVMKMAGSIPDPEFKRHPQGEYEVRDPL